MFTTECKCVRPGATSTQHAGARLRVTWPGTGTQSRGAQRTRSNNSPEVVPKVEYAAKFLSLDKLEKRKNKMCFIHVFSKIRNQTHKCPQSMHFIFSNTCTYLLSCRMAIFIFQFFSVSKNFSEVKCHNTRKRNGIIFSEPRIAIGLFGNVAAS